MAHLKRVIGEHKVIEVAHRSQTLNEGMAHAEMHESCSLGDPRATDAMHRARSGRRCHTKNAGLA